MTFPPYHRNEIEMIRKAIDGVREADRPQHFARRDTDRRCGSRRSHANMWRIIDDFWDNWSELNAHFSLFEK